MKIKVIARDAEKGGYWATAPSLPGLYTQGETLEELEANAREAVGLYLADGEVEERGALIFRRDDGGWAR